MLTAQTLVSKNIAPSRAATRGSQIEPASRGARPGAPAASGQPGDGRGQKVRAMLRARLGDDIFTCWFNALEIDGFDGRLVKMSVPVKFLRNWIQSHYAEDLLACCRAEFPGAERVEILLRQPGAQPPRPAVPALEAAPVKAAEAAPSRPMTGRSVPPPSSRTQVGDLEGSPLHPHYTFDSFVVGGSNRMAHAGATQVAETILSGAPGFNPLYLHSSVGLGKTHLLHAIAWEVKRRAPQAHVLYLTAERFRYQFVEAVRSQDPFAFKDKFRSIHVLLIDDLEFMQGERTEQEFDHIINSLLDGGRQVVVASARAPGHVDRLNERMRSRLQRGLVTEIGGLDYELRLKILEKRLVEKQAADSSFELPRGVLELLADRLTESGRELEGAVTRLHAMWQYMRTAITMDIAETVIRDLVQGVEPRRIKIEDILRIVSRHYGVSKADLLSPRRQRSIVWPRQIGMYLAKQLTSRSLPEIGRRFNGRDHTTVLHAVRKIERELTDNPRLKNEIEELKKMLSH